MCICGECVLTAVGIWWLRMGSRRRRCRLIIITINGSLQKSTSSMWRCWWWEARNLSGVESQCRLIMFSYSAVLLLLLGQTVIQRESRGPSRVLFGRSSQATSLTKPHHRTAFHVPPKVLTVVVGRDVSSSVESENA